jgi:hypothetical protein
VGVLQGGGGWSSPFIGAGEHRGGGCWEVMAGVKLLMPLMAGGRLRRGFKGRGNQGGGVIALTGHLEARSWTAGVARSGWDLRRRGRASAGRRRG